MKFRAVFYILCLKKAAAENFQNNNFILFQCIEIFIEVFFIFTKY